MEHLAVDTRTLPERDRIEAWEQALSSVGGPIHVDPIPGEDFSGELSSIRRGSFFFYDLRYSGMRLWRRPVDVAKMNQELFALSLTLPSCSLHVERDGRALTLQGGQAYLFNHAATYRTQPPSAYKTRTIAFPGRLLRQRVRDLRHFYALTECIGSSGGLGLIHTFAKHLAQGAADWSADEVCTLSDQFLDLLALFLGSGSAAASPCESSESAMRAGHRQRALQHIRAQAADPDLSPARVAQACGISMGYLHEVFRGFDMGVEQTIFEERLELARRLLSDPRRRRVPIQALAYEAGFNDPAHFSRRFKRRFGVTPGELRTELKHPARAR
ncbi:helix-turn-helix domain-containing protein [Xenophilus arseniciresistens]|uniref:Helix-turn-helix domain-containing protein n=1 Tax=Xenophilus arseniciresistens TaxID=1283306 RepID=A0AAE3NCK6_9BURK|nr:helix-turn-helix domain-containing protein [Xenophilus arseniciresistens]MDA7418331.1 helix-turn-helix domain-containing protein [Xenophilus arseniciresistens]